MHCILTMLLAVAWAISSKLGFLLCMVKNLADALPHVNSNLKLSLRPRMKGFQHGCLIFELPGQCLLSFAIPGCCSSTSHFRASQSWDFCCHYLSVCMQFMLSQKSKFLNSIWFDESQVQTMKVLKNIWRENFCFLVEIHTVSFSVSLCQWECWAGVVFNIDVCFHQDTAAFLWGIIASG